MGEGKGDRSSYRRSEGRENIEVSHDQWVLKGMRRRKEKGKEENGDDGGEEQNRIFIHISKVTTRLELNIMLTGVRRGGNVWKSERDSH